jgi:GNAT superfamily N-acetyltransferase
MIIRRPRADELDNILIVMEYYRDEANLPDGEYDSNEMTKTVREFLIDPAHAWFCMYEQQRMVGIVAGYLCPIPWSRKITANVQFLYVLPSHRNLASAVKLLKEFETWAWNQGAVKITAGDIGIDVERTQTFYEHCGYRVQGITLDKVYTDE